VVETLIIGAGPAGLTAGYMLARAGHEVAILESDPRYVGGISRTAEYKGFLFDIGGHRFFSKSKEVNDLWDEILGDDFLDRPRLSRIYYGGKFYAYPLRAFEALRNLGLIESIGCVLSYAWSKARPIPAPRTFHEWVRNQFGERLFQIFFKTYTEKVWGMSCDEISADWAAQRIKGLDLKAAVWDGLKRSLGLHKGAGGPATAKTLIESFRYPRKGPGMLWEACADKIKANGGQVVMGQKVIGLAWSDEQQLWAVTAAGVDGREGRFLARNVVSSAPMRELCQAIAPAPAALPNALELKYRDFLTVVLIGKAREALPDNWIYIHDPSVKVGRVQNFRSWSPEMTPDPALVTLGLEYFCFEGDGLWTAADEDLAALARREIDKIGLMQADDVVDACVVRQPKAYPVYDDFYRDHVEAIRTELEAAYPTLHLVGRNGMHKYNNQDHAMMTGMLTAENIKAGARLFDPWRVNEDAVYTEAGQASASQTLFAERLTPQSAAPAMANAPAA
jgi:protoporphyrinogen oxidase